MNKEFEDNQQTLADENALEKEKIALIEITPYQAKLTLAWYVPGSFEVFDEYLDELYIHEDIERDGYIKPTQVAHCKEVVKMYRKLCDSFGITKSIAYATCDLRSAKNHYGFIDELEISSGFKFKFLTEDEEISAIHASVVNTMDVSKGVIISIEPEQTRIASYVRRCVVTKQIVPFGYSSLCKLFMEGQVDYEKQCQTIKEFFLKQIKEVSWFNDMELTDLQFVGLGDVFEAVGKISRKGKKYPLDIAHNYKMTKNDFANVYNAIMPLKLDKEARLKGISEIGVGAIVSGLGVIQALIEYFNIINFSISTHGISTGILFKHCVPLTNDKPLQDLLGYSLETNQRFYQEWQSNGAHVFELAMLLFKQLRVMHRLPRMYVKPLKIACYMYNCGKRVRYSSSKKDCLNIILHSELFGASHRDLILAAFIASCQFVEDFSLSEWVKYKDFVNDEDLQAIKKLSVMVRIAAGFDVSQSGYVKDVICDVLGDSVIVKTITDCDISFEIKMANKANADFKKVFEKSLELL